MIKKLFLIFAAFIMLSLAGCEERTDMASYENAVLQESEKSENETTEESPPAENARPEGITAYEEKKEAAEEESLNREEAANIASEKASQNEAAQETPCAVDDKTEVMQISVVSGDYEIIYKLNNSQGARDLYDQLPLDVEAEPFSDNEMIFYPPQGLNTEDMPLSEGGTGSLSYYAPWGDVVMFYDSFSPNDSLYELGQAVSGEENIENSAGRITVSKAE